MAKEKIIKEKVTDPNSHRNHEGSFSQLINVLKYGKRTEKNIAIVILIIVLILFIGLGYLCWFRWLPDVWNWGFNPISVKAILSVLAALYLLIIPFFSFVFVNKYVSSINTTRAQIEIEDELSSKEALFENIFPWIAALICALIIGFYLFARVPEKKKR